MYILRLNLFKANIRPRAVPADLPQPFGRKDIFLHRREKLRRRKDLPLGKSAHIQHGSVISVGLSPDSHTPPLLCGHTAHIISAPHTRVIIGSVSFSMDIFSVMFAVNSSLYPLPSKKLMHKPWCGRSVSLQLDIA